MSIYKYVYVYVCKYIYIFQNFSKIHNQNTKENHDPIGSLHICDIYILALNVSLVNFNN